jgi:hypothetical protein
LRNVLHLDEEYESIKVQQVTEVTWPRQIGSIIRAKTLNAN